MGNGPATFCHARGDGLRVRCTTLVSLSPRARHKLLREFSPGVGPLPFHEMEKDFP